MSAIAGIWHFDGAPNVGSRLQRMLAALSMYGEDSAASLEPPCALGRNLMRLLPEDRFDRQPLTTTDQRCSLVAHVRLDNREELGDRLGLAPATLSAMADSSLLGSAWQQWGERCLEYLLGDFSFAVWDRVDRRLFMARDHAGTYPLFYHHRPERWFALASMPKGLFALPEIPPVLDEDRIACYLALVPSPQGRNLFRDIERLPPAHCLTVTDRSVQLRRYWGPEHSPEIRLRSDGEYLEAFRDHLDTAVGSRLRGVGGVGSHLSAGLDSGSVSATAARLLGASNEVLTGFTAVPRSNSQGASAGRLGDEGPAAAEVAALYPNIRHVLVDSSASSFLDILDPYIASAGEPPFNPTNSVWISAIQREAKAQGLRVILTGASGNATISRVGTGVLSEWFRRGAWPSLLRTCWALRRRRNVSIRALALETAGPSLPRWARRRWIRPDLSLSHSLVNSQAASRLNLRERAWDAINTPFFDGRAGPRQLLSRIDPGPHYLAARAIHSLDERDPTRDKRLVEFCFGIPSEQYVRGGQTRSLIRRAMQDRLPASTLNRRSRGQQSADWHLGMGAIRERMQQEVATLEQSPIARRCMDLARARELLANWPEGDFHNREVAAAWHMSLSRGLSVGRFILHFDPDAPNCRGGMRFDTVGSVP